jgi:hypothetical protein
MRALYLPDLTTPMGLGAKSSHPIHSSCLSLGNRWLAARALFGTRSLGFPRLSSREGNMRAVRSMINPYSKDFVGSQRRRWARRASANATSSMCITTSVHL